MPRSRKSSKPSKASYSAEATPVCRMCLSTDGALETVISDERGAYLLQKILAYTGVQFDLLAKGPSYLCSTCRTRLDSLDKFRCLCVRTNEIVQRVREKET